MSDTKHILYNTDDLTSDFEQTGHQFAKASGILHIAAMVSGAFAYWGSFRANNALQTAGAPDAMLLAEGISLIMISGGVISFCLIAGQILRYWAHSKYELRPPYLWRIQLYAALFTLPFNWLVSGFILIHLFLNKDFYE